MIKCASGFTYDQITKGENNNADVLDDTMTSSACEDTCWNYHDDDMSCALPTISLAPMPVPPKQMLEEELHKVFYDSLCGNEWTNNDD